MARTDSYWETVDEGGYIKTIAPAGYDILINGTNKYLNFNTLNGSTGYGFRDNNGTMEVKNSGGAWTPVGTGAGTVTSVSGTSNRITSSGGATPVIDIAATYVGQTSITTLGTIGTGTWQGTKIGLLYGGTNADLSATGGAGKYLKQNSSGAAITVTTIAESELTFTDIVTNNSSTTQHGFLAKLDNVATHYMDGTGNWSVPPGSGGTPTIITVANEGTDTTCFPAFFTAATGDLGPKTNANLTYNSNTGAFSIGTGSVFTAGTIELGAASDTTIARVGAGQISVEGVNIVTISSTDVLTNKTLTTPVINGTITGTGQATAATASTIMMRDSNANTSINNLVEGFTTTATAAGTTTMDITFKYTQVWTGSSAQTIKLPTTSVLQGQQYLFINQSTGALTIQSSAANTIIIVAANTSALLTAVVATPTTAANWSALYYGDIITSAKSLTVTQSLTLSGTDGTTMTFPGSSKTLAANDGSNFTIASQAIGDLLTASSTTAYTRIAAVATGSVLVSQGTGTAPVWSANPQLTTIELGNASDTTIARVSGGVISVEGVTIDTISAANTLTNKTLTTPVINGTITGTGQATAATASTIMMRDTNGNSAINNMVEGFTTTATAAGTTTMDITFKYTQVWTGSSAQTIKLPTTSVLQGQQYLFINQSTGALTIQSSGANNILVVNGGGSALLTAVVATPTTAANWSALYFGDSVASGKLLTVSNTLTFTGTDSSSVAFGAGGTVVYTTVTTLSSLVSVGTITTGGLGTGAVIGGVTMTLGSDANYDIYYRNSSGVLTRLANGTTGQVLTATTGNAPSWTTLSSGGIAFAPQDIVVATGLNQPANHFCFASNTTGSVAFFAENIGSGTLNIYRMARDTTGGSYYITHTTALTISTTQFGGLGVAGSFLYVWANVGGVGAIRRYAIADLSGVTSMTGTIAGVAALGTMWSDGTNLFLYTGSSGNFNKYTISGTAVTDTGAVAFTSAGVSPSGASDGTNVWLTDTSGSSINIRKYPIAGGAVTSTTTMIVQAGAMLNGNSTSYTMTQLMMAGTGTLGIGWMFNWCSASAVVGLGIHLFGIAAP